MICVPLLHAGRALGVLKVASATTFTFGPADVETLKLLAQIIAVSMHQAAEYAATLHESLHDALTGLPNRRSFDAELARAVERHRRHAAPLCLALLDLDGFKKVNDELGHAAGDEVLQEVARQLRQQLRSIDGCFRVGGDEFALLLPDTAREGAELGVERCCAAIREARLGDGRVGVSAGIVEAANESPEGLVQRADEQMYAMKRGRRS
jgi:diguanylate cyclase (GGDEF)-like protein